MWLRLFRALKVSVFGCSCSFRLPVFSAFFLQKQPHHMLSRDPFCSILFSTCWPMKDRGFPRIFRHFGNPKNWGVATSHSFPALCFGQGLHAAYLWQRYRHAGDVWTLQRVGCPEVPGPNWWSTGGGLINSDQFCWSLAQPFLSHMVKICQNVKKTWNDMDVT